MRTGLLVGSGRLRLAALAAAAVALGLVLAPGALADAIDDYNAVEDDYAAHGRSITHCRFTREQLRNAVDVYQSFGDISYGSGDPRFVPSVNAELAYRRAGRCRIPPGTPTSGSRLSLAVSPGNARIHRRTTFTFTVTGRQSGHRVTVKGAVVSFAGVRAKTDGHGRARIVRRLNSAGRQMATAIKRGLKSASASVRVTR